MKKLTIRDNEILEFIRNYIKEHGYAPTYDEIGAGVQLYSKSSVYEHVKKLIYLGEIETDHPGSPRTIRLKTV